jgi:hypothetical protein
MVVTSVPEPAFPVPGLSRMPQSSESDPSVAPTATLRPSRSPDVTWVADPVLVRFRLIP